MSTSGPKPKPTRRKLLEGNPGRRPLNTQEPTPPPADATFDAPPPELTGHADAIAEWTRIVPMLREARVITHAERGPLIALCLEWARYLHATREVAAKGMVVAAPSGYPVQNPYISIATKALAGCAKLWPELGLTPSSRARLTTTGGPADDGWAEFDTPPGADDATRH